MHFYGTSAFSNVLLTTNAITYYMYVIFTVLVILNVICDCGMVKAVDAVMCYTQGSVKVSVEVDY